ncbi:PA3496 family putative envelope integrity protein [Pseudocolwellia sp. HL-MZ19]|uniref:PA3496 family putative envelope integrity protein n=1 Tax=unclassified Pseudocolwellia TaxID=2848178 RepID=UPI003CF342B2
MSDDINSVEDISNNDDKISYDDDLAKGDKAERNSQVRQRIEDMLERKRLKELLDDSDDWEL